MTSDKREAMERIIRACFQAGYRAGASGQYPRPVVPTIEWEGNSPQITGFEEEPERFPDIRISTEGLDMVPLKPIMDGTAARLKRLLGIGDRAQT